VIFTESVSLHHMVARTTV